MQRLGLENVRMELGREKFNGRRESAWIWFDVKRIDKRKIK